MTADEMVKIIEERNLNVEFFGKTTRNCWIFGNDGHSVDAQSTKGATIIEAFESALSALIKKERRKE